MMYQTVCDPVVKTETPYLDGHRMYYERSKHQLSVYDKVPTYVYSDACVTFQFSFCPNKGQLEI